jgi:hypothetical protein
MSKPATKAKPASAKPKAEPQYVPITSLLILDRGAAATALCRSTDWIDQERAAGKFPEYDGRFGDRGWWKVETLQKWIDSFQEKKS